MRRFSTLFQCLIKVHYSIKTFIKLNNNYNRPYIFQKPRMGMNFVYA